jgi:ArsR family transcriptional regulator
MKNNKVNIDSQKLELSSDILRALAHPLRLQILEFIDQNKKINVNKIYNTLKLEQSITSQHLRILRDAEILETRRTGKYIFYSLNYNRIDNSVIAVKNFLVKQTKRVSSEIE